jgi:hypothetical protein
LLQGLTLTTERPGVTRAEMVIAPVVQVKNSSIATGV